MDGSPWIATAVALVLLVAIATVGLVLLRARKPTEIASALLRAALQLAALSLILAGVIRDPLLTALALTVMFAGAVGTAAHRSGDGWAGVPRLAGAIASAAAIPLIIVFASGAVEFTPRYVLAVGGIVIGGTMTVVIVTQRVLRSTARDRWAEVEGWLALGARPAEALRDIARDSVRTALLPSIDQTRTTGVVVLPGAFVGAIFAGASPIEAGRFQLIVLASLLAAGVVASSVAVRITPVAPASVATSQASSTGRPPKLEPR